MLNRNEVASLLGVSTMWLIRNAEQGPSRYKLPGGLIRYRAVDIENWLRQRRIE